MIFNLLQYNSKTAITFFKKNFLFLNLFKYNTKNIKRGKEISKEKKINPSATHVTVRV